MIYLPNDTNKINRMTGEEYVEIRRRDKVGTPGMIGGPSNSDTRRGDSRSKKNQELAAVKSTQKMTV